ncbi:MAG: hypothetical protein KME05_12425 [Gloeocapsa sp. UFS-A4-WI-NPMV-4B04]|jgi:transposase-like protein|nr:hypothetical protein [Gloeocapsa sp. UFS-A4-WI-NPMV-4B04]
MMRQRDEVLSSLSPEQIVSTLEACSLEDKQEFTEDEAARIEYCRSLVEQQSKSYKQAAAQMKRQDKSTQHITESEPEAELLDISELLARASKQCKTRIPLAEVVQILDNCGLPDKDEYTSLESDRFLEACKLIKQQNKSYEEVATHFGINNGLPDTSMQQVENIVETMATNADALTDELLQQSAEAKALNDAQKYMVYYAKAAAEGQQVQEFWARLREHAQSRLTGKSPARLIRAEPEANFILQSSPNSSDSSPTSENGTTSE